MKHFILLLLIVPFFTFCGEQKENNSNNSKEDNSITNTPTDYKATFYLLRHAEKVVTNPQDQDPSLNIDGMMRAKRWATYFEPIKIDEIYITKYVRTKQTISLIAQQKAVSPKRYDPNTLYSEEFLKMSDGKTIIIAGHSNTTPRLVNKLLGEEKFKDMDDNDNSTLYKVTINGNNRKVETITVE